MLDRINWLDVGTLTDIPRRGARVVTLPGGDVAVFRTADDQLFALRDRCPHGGGPLSQGIVHGHKVTCPLHNWTFALSSGEAQAPDEGCAGTIPVELRQGRILLGVTAALGG